MIVLVVIVIAANSNRTSRTVPSNALKVQNHPDSSRLTVCSQQMGTPNDCVRLQSLEKSTDYPGFGESNFDIVMCSKNSVNIDNTLMTAIYMVRNQLKLNCFSSSVVFTYSTDKLHNGIYTFKGVNNAWSNVLAGMAMVTVNGEQKIYTYKSKYDLNKNELTLFLEDSSSEVAVLKGSVVVTVILTDCVSNVAPGDPNNPTFNLPNGGTNTMSR